MQSIPNAMRFKTNLTRMCEWHCAASQGLHPKCENDNIKVKLGLDIVIFPK